MFRKNGFKKVNQKIIILLAVICAGFYFILQTNCSQATGPTEVKCNITVPTVWIKENSPYIIKNFIYAYAELTIKPGTIIKFNRGAQLAIYEGLNATGTEDNKIIFTSIRDDSAGGDTNKDGAATNPAKGDWLSIYFYKGGQSIMEHVVVSYGSTERTVMGAVTMNLKDNIIIRNSEIKNSGYAGIFIYNSQPTIENNIISNNRTGVLSWSRKTPKITNNSIFDNNQGAGVIFSFINRLDATNNWWGDNSGPYHATLNPIGQGNRVGDGVIFDPWIGKIKGKDPVIIVPGIMGSWNVSGEWELDPILHTYDNLWEAFKLAGYEEDKTLFAFPYQWRDSNVISAGYLKDKIKEVKNICDCEKVDIVAHSMGGLVARYYVESNDYEQDIDQLVFLGTPHKGAPKAYLQWEAAEGFESPKEKIAKIYFSIEAYLMGYGSLFEYIQDRVKSVEQLLPVYSYLQDTGSIPLREYNQNLYPGNYPYNPFLESLNLEENLNKFSNSGVKIFSITGDNGDNTIGVINVSSGEQYYPLWKHGYMEEIIYISGDKTVPHMSSSLFIPTVIENTEHMQIPTNAQKQIIEYLTGQMPVIEINDTPEPEEILVVAIHSPADFIVISPSGKRLGKDFLSNANINEIDYGFYAGFENEPEFAVIINPEQGDYRVELQGTGNGEYKLDLSYIDKEKEIIREFTGNIQTAEEHSFDFIYSEDDENPISELEPDDNIPPEITINNPVENEQYLHSEELIIDYTATDDFSGIDTTIIKLDEEVLDTTIIDLFYHNFGEHILNITAVDNAGNSASAEIKFEIIANIASTIQDIERIYDLDWISKKYVKHILIVKLKVLQKRLDIFVKQKEIIEKLKQKISDNPKIKEKRKQKLLDKFDKRLEKLEQQEDKFIKKSLDKIEKSLNKFYNKKMINQQGYDIIINNINYLRENL